MNHTADRMQTGFAALGKRNAAKIKRAIQVAPDGECDSIAIDMGVADAVFDRLNITEEGFVARQVKMAAACKTPTDAQIALLVTFAYRGADHE